MKAEQPRKVLKDTYDRPSAIRELEVLHKRLNDLILSPAVAVLSDTKANYAAGDVGTAAAIAAALNAVAGAVNNLNTAVNQILEKINAS